VTVGHFFLIIILLVTESIGFTDAKDTELPDSLPSTTTHTFFKTVPDKKTTRKTLSDLFADESGEVSILSDPLNLALGNIFLFSIKAQLEILEDLAQRLDKVTDPLKQLSVLVQFANLK
jgi:hypothetical protein